MANDKTLSPAKIFERLISRIDRYLTKAKRPRAFKDAGFSQAVRADLFKLEGWAKIHRHWPIKKEAKVFAQIREHSKRLEDQLGVLDLARTLSVDMKSRGQNEIAALFDNFETKARSDLKFILNDDSWFVHDDGETRIEKMRRHLDSIDWPKSDPQLDYLCGALTRDLADVSEKYRLSWKPELVKTTYERKTLETALHEWRRQLRWFAIYFQTADGLFGLAPTGSLLTVDKKKLIAEYGDNPFAQLPTKSNTEVFLDRVAYLELTRLIDRIGRLKERAERFFYVRDFLVKNGETFDNASDRARSLYGEVPTEISVETQKLLNEYEKFKPLAYLAESL